MARKAAPGSAADVTGIMPAETETKNRTEQSKREIRYFKYQTQVYL